MISGDGKFFRRDEKEDIVIEAKDFDIGFITGRDVVNGAFVFEIKLMAIKSGSGSIVENGLIRDIDVEDRTHN